MEHKGSALKCTQYSDPNSIIQAASMKADGMDDSHDPTWGAAQGNAPSNGLLRGVSGSYRPSTVLLVQALHTKALVLYLMKENWYTLG